MGILSSLIIGSISGLVYIYFVKYLITQNLSNSLDDDTIMRSLSMVQLHIMYIFLIYGYVHSIDPMAGDREINALLDETFIGDIVGFFTDVNTEPNYQAIAIVNEMQDSANMFLFIGFGLCAVESLGLIGRRVGKWTIECISIICTIASYLYLRKIYFFQEEIVSQSKIEGIFNFFGESFVSSFSWIETMLNIGIIILVINHVLQHKALNKYYGESKIEHPHHIMILIAASLGVMYLFNKYFLNPEISLNINNNEVYDSTSDIDANTEATLSSSASSNDIFKTRLSQIQSDPNKLILSVNQMGNKIYYLEKNEIGSFKNVIYKCDFQNDIITEINFDNITCMDGTEIDFFNLEDVIIHDEIIVLIGGNGWSGLGYTNYGLRFIPETESFKILFSCNSDIERKGRIFILTQRDLLSFGESSVDNEYYFYKELYDINGTKLDGFSVSGKGKIDKYPIRLFFHSLEGIVTGWYRYEGHDNYMTIKGKVQNNQFVFTEYDEKGIAFATFKGDVDFEKQLLVGTFNRDNSELNFWIYNEDDLRSCVEAWNYIHTPYLGNCANYTDLYGESVSFYGRTFTSKQCVEHFLSLINKYDSYSQKIVSEINYTSIDDNTTRCDFTKGVEFNGKYKEYEAYLVLHRRNEYSPWKIIVESDKTTDYNLNKTNR